MGKIEVVQVDLTRMTQEQREKFHQQGFNILTKGDNKRAHGKNLFALAFAAEIRKNNEALEGLKC